MNPFTDVGVTTEGNYVLFVAPKVELKVLEFVPLDDETRELKAEPHRVQMPFGLLFLEVDGVLIRKFYWDGDFFVDVETMECLIDATESRN